MDISQFKAGIKQKGYDYYAFIPENVNHTYSWKDSDLTKLIDSATLRLGELNAFSQLVPNIDHFIRMHVVKEATVSSKIEGTQTNMEEALLKEKDIQPENKNDWQEVNNYIVAMNRAVKSLDKLPLSSRLLKEAHQILLDGVRGEHKMPGDFRRSQNWIGGVSIKDASYIPPFWESVEMLMGDLENLMHNDNCGLPHLMRIALAHYQFETIHPFLDGNGRIGRLMITLYLVSQNVLRKPVLYLSDFFEKNKSLYYDNLTRVRTNNDLIHWLKFFLIGVETTATNSINGLKAIISLKKEVEEKRIYTLGKKINIAKQLVDYLFQQPIIDVDDVIAITGLS
ncbi:MAG: Fic family protein, partial [Bacteroidetes bacterium]|nr:Fic family protein [Bacteroidota bacterium]